MLAKRIIPCLDVKEGKVVKGVKFNSHQIVGDILTLAESYCEQGADELVFYDITASPDRRCVDYDWVKRIASVINIPFCVAGGINSVATAEKILNAGADKISINSPALARPELINELAQVFGQQCVVIGIDSLYVNDQYYVYQYTGNSEMSASTSRLTTEWVVEVQARGAGEIVLNCMNEDGVRKGYDLKQLTLIRALTTLPLIASGGAGEMQHFLDVFKKTNVEGALAASVFHRKMMTIDSLKSFLQVNAVEVRI